MIETGSIIMTPPSGQPWFAPHLDVAGRSRSGLAGFPIENQDNFLLIDGTGRARFLDAQQEREQLIPAWPPGHARIAVLDGMGGHGHGREAAEAVVRGLLLIPACTELAELSAHLDRLHAQLQRDFGAHVPATQRPGTTLTLLEVPAGRQQALLYHVGDSRLYQIKPGQTPLPLTVDHVPATVYAIDGALDDMDWWQQVHGEHRSQIAQAFILGNAFSNSGQLHDSLLALTPDNLPPFLAHLPDRRALPLDPDAIYVLASDGFWACPSPQLWLARWPALLHQHDSADAMCGALFAALARTPPPELHPDNLTAIVLRPLRHDVTALPSDAGEN